MKRYNTPHRSRVVKTRMTEEEYAEFAQRLFLRVVARKPLHLLSGAVLVARLSGRG